VRDHLGRRRRDDVDLPRAAATQVEATARPDTLDGPFDAKGYADFVSAVNSDDASSLARDLAAYGMTRGYGLSWNVPTRIFDTQEASSPLAMTCLR
jgi:hypothetical protein